MDLIRVQNVHTLLFLRFWFQNLISGPLGYRVFRETGPRELNPTKPVPEVVEFCPAVWPDNQRGGLAGNSVAFLQELFSSLIDLVA